MEKKWYKSKTFYGSLLVALGVVGSFVNGNLDVLGLVTGLGAAFGITGIRDALD